MSCVAFSSFFEFSRCNCSRPCGKAAAATTKTTRSRPKSRKPCLNTKRCEREPDPKLRQDGEHADEPEALPQLAGGEAGHGEAQVGPRVQGVPCLDGRIHEPPARQHGGVHRRLVHRRPRRGASQVLTGIRLIFKLVGQKRGDT